MQEVKLLPFSEMSCNDTEEKAKVVEFIKRMYNMHDHLKIGSRLATDDQKKFIL